MDFKQSLRRLLFGNIEERIEQEEKLLSLLADNLALLNKELGYLHQIVMSHNRAFESLKEEQGITEFPERNVIKYNV